jgi:hypothetical protein
VFVLVDLTSQPPAVTLEEPDDTTRFHVTVRGGQPGADLALVFGALVDAAAGRLEGGDAWITVDAIRRLGAGRVGPAWDDDVTAMLDYADAKGWFDPATHAIRAHVEWSP